MLIISDIANGAFSELEKIRVVKKLRVTINERHNSSPKYKIIINEIVELYFFVQFR